MILSRKMNDVISHDFSLSIVCHRQSPFMLTPHRGAWKPRSNIAVLVVQASWAGSLQIIAGVSLSYVAPRVGAGRCLRMGVQVSSVQIFLIMRAAADGKIVKYSRIRGEDTEIPFFLLSSRASSYVTNLLHGVARRFFYYRSGQAESPTVIVRAVRKDLF